MRCKAWLDIFWFEFMFKVRKQSQRASVRSAVSPLLINYCKTSNIILFIVLICFVTHAHTHSHLLSPCRPARAMIDPERVVWSVDREKRRNRGGRLLMGWLCWCGCSPSRYLCTSNSWWAHWKPRYLRSLSCHPFPICALLGYEREISFLGPILASLCHHSPKCAMRLRLQEF